MSCDCCNVCNAYGYSQIKNKNKSDINNPVESNIKNGCWLCNNQYYNLNNKSIYNYNMFDENIIPPCNIKCQINVDNYLRHGNKS